MGRNHADFYPEIQTQDNQGAWELGGKGYIAIQSCDDGWDYTLYHSDFSVMDGGQVDAPELTIQEVREQILEAHHMERGDGCCRTMTSSWTEPQKLKNLVQTTAIPRWKNWLRWLAQKKNAMSRSAAPLGAGKRGMLMNFNGEELMLMMLYNSGTRLGLMQELRLMQCYLLPDETALRELSEGVIEKLKLISDADFDEVGFPLN